MEYLNGQIEYWMNHLIGGKIRMVFDRYLNVQLSRESGEPFSYKQGSEGEKKRIDFTISLAFADLMRVSNNTNNNLIFLDEIVDSLDRSGVGRVAKLIRELGKEKIVFLDNLRSKLEYFSKQKSTA